MSIRSYDVYGVVMASDYDFANPIPPAPDEAAADLEFRCGPPPVHGVDWASGRVVDAEGLRTDGSPDFVFVRFESHDAIRITAAADFHIYDDAIECHLLDERHRYLVEIALLGMVFALWLERRGTPTLHAGATVVDGSAVAFLGIKGGGKTTTVAALLAAGHALLADDLVALSCLDTGPVAHRGVPALRLWPAQLDHFVGSYDDLDIVHPDYDKRRVDIGAGGFGRFAAGAAPLRRLYLPVRSEHVGRPTLQPLRQAEVLIELVRHSFLPREVHRFGWQGARLRLLSQVVGAVPVARLLYPSGLQHLAEVVATVEADVQGR